MNAIPWERIKNASNDNPIRILTSACLVGHRVGWNDQPYPCSIVQRLVQNPKVHALHFCPENLILGTPRLLTTLHKGNGFDVLDGIAEVRDTQNNDLTEKFLYSAQQFYLFAQKQDVELAILLEISDSCGSSAVYLGNPEEKRYQKGPGVSAAMLMRKGIPVVGSRDYRQLGAILRILEEDESILKDEIDFCEIDWFREYFKETQLR